MVVFQKVRGRDKFAWPNSLVESAGNSEDHDTTEDSSGLCTKPTCRLE